MIKTKGLSALLSDVSVTKARFVEKMIDKEVSKITNELAVKTANDAPVKTGKLRDSLTNDVAKVEHLKHEIRLDLENVPYVWKQNFEHQTKRYFITRNFNEVESQFGDRIQKVVDRAW